MAHYLIYPPIDEWCARQRMLSRSLWENILVIIHWYSHLFPVAKAHEGLGNRPLPLIDQSSQVLMIREFFSSIRNDRFCRQGLQHLYHSLYEQFAFLDRYLLDFKKTRIAIR